MVKRVFGTKTAAKVKERQLWKKNRRARVIKVKSGYAVFVDGKREHTKRK